MTLHLRRRDFLSQIATTGLASGLLPSVDIASRWLPDEPFVLPLMDDDASVFAAARKRFLFPTSVTSATPARSARFPAT